MEENFVNHKDVVGLYNVGIVEVDSLVKAILAVNCRGLSLNKSMLRAVL